jgi:hypothetical protein
VETKPFYLTSEFYLTIVAGLVPAGDLLHIYNILTGWHDGIIIAVVVGLYSLARGQAKSSVPFDAVKYRQDKKALKAK